MSKQEKVLPRKRPFDAADPHWREKAYKTYQRALKTARDRHRPAMRAAQARQHARQEVVEHLGASYAEVKSIVAEFGAKSAPQSVV